MVWVITFQSFIKLYLHRYNHFACQDSCLLSLFSYTTTKELQLTRSLKKSDMTTQGSAMSGDGGNRESNVTMRSLVRGTLSLSKLKPFVYLVKSLCPETGQILEFREYDRVYNPSAEVRAMKNSLRLRIRLQQSRTAMPAGQASMAASTTLEYAGPPDRRAPPPIERRPITTVAIGRDADALLTALGCSLAFEYLRKIVRHQTRSGLTVDVFLVEKLVQPNDPSTSVPITTQDDQHCVVEIWADDLSSPDTLLTFSQYLSPYVTWHSQSARRRWPLHTPFLSIDTCTTITAQTVNGHISTYICTCSFSQFVDTRNFWPVEQVPRFLVIVS